MNFTNNWSTGAVELIDLGGSNALHFIENDFILNKALIDKRAVINASFVFKGLDFGIIMKYNEVEYDDGNLSSGNFLLFSVNGSYAKLSKVAYNKDAGWYAYSIKDTQFNFQIDSTIKLTADISDTVYKFYINDTPVMSVKIEDNTFRTGLTGIFSYADNYCKTFTISTEIPSNWQFDTPSDKYIGTVGDEH